MEWSEKNMWESVDELAELLRRESVTFFDFLRRCVSLADGGECSEAHFDTDEDGAYADYHCVRMGTTYWITAETHQVTKHWLVDLDEALRLLQPSDVDWRREGF